MENNNAPAPFYYKYILLAVIVLGLVGAFFLVNSVFKGIDNKDKDTEEEDYVEQIEIPNIENYDACIIYNQTPYFLVKQAVIEESAINKRVSYTSHRFEKNQDDMYYAYQGATYGYDEGYNIYSLIGIDGIAVYYKDSLGYDYFARDYEAASEDAEITNRKDGEGKIYKDTSGTKSTITASFDVSILSNMKEVDEIPEYDNELHDIYAITISKDNICYIYGSIYSIEDHILYIVDEITGKNYELEINMEDYIFEDNSNPTTEEG